ncbi:Aldehyde ferredoxin oxidoreductase, C-terminal [Moorella glycerini]|uniref:Oxidoreductase YdhV n=1 Tax=Neomoorella stamsii TaxID=1266720 RepID=A0A9X7J551_9FIRM|nr:MULTISPECIES: aldehyde ferredoxin oxidoreductase family protein [Moorella]PRR73976.1 putative oxidoreductase YdhV [Moorella stamsii]CEP66187.1 Aldehyde ferredoxin oxidoreductase, C-terminal [Moorella glycerini]
MTKEKVILQVDLSAGRTWTEPISKELEAAFLGSRGINAKLLWDLVRPGTDPLGPENVLIFGAGKLSGTGAPSSGRTTITCKSPATGLYLKANSGGHWGTELRYAGYDHVVVRGAAAQPVYIYIEDGLVEIRSAAHLWGKDVRETTRILREELGEEIEVACIGQAGENLVRMAGVMCSIYNTAARGGAGAVMGSKKLKAIAVKGSGEIALKDPATYWKVVQECVKGLLADSGASGLHAYGTSGSVLPLNELRGFAVDNWRRGSHPNLEKISGQTLADKYLKRKVGCNSCILGCHRYTELDHGKYAGSYSGGPELETLGALGCGCGVYEWEYILKGNELCNIYGMDTISVGNVIAWAMECYERGVLTKKDTGGLELTWGNGEVVVEMVRQIAFRQGLGNLLAEGVRRAAQQVGQDSWKWAIEVKGLEQSRVDTRKAMAYALAFAVNPRGADHLHTETFAEFGLSPEARAIIKDITGDEKYANPYSTDKRAEIVRWHEDCYAVTDCLGFCAFTTTALFGVTPDRMARLFAAATGLEMSEEEIMKAGRRIMNLEKAFNVREGAARQDDTAPWRLLNEPAPDLPEGATVLSQEKLDEMLDAYYILHNWDLKTSWPKRETLVELGLDEVARELEAMGKLPG